MSWTRVVCKGTTPPPRGGHCCARIGNSMYIFGGANRTPSAHGDLWLLSKDEGQYTWTNLQPSAPENVLLPARTSASMTAVEGKLYIFGGQDPHTGQAFNDVVVCDPVERKWTRVEIDGQQGSPPPRHSHTACLFHHNKILVYGGAGSEGPVGDVWVFDTQLAEWSRPAVKGQAPAPREMHCAVVAGQHGLVVFGGRAGGGAVLSDVNILNTDTLEWSKSIKTSFARCAHAGAMLDLTGQIYFFGGFSGTAVESDVLHLDLETSKMQKAPSFMISKTMSPGPRFAHVAFDLEPNQNDCSMIVVGGVTPEEDLADVIAYSVVQPNVTAQCPIANVPASDLD